MTSAYYVHSRLRLIHGLPAISGDTNTNESVKKTVDLLSAGGFNLATDFGAWVPRLGALAGGGNYLQLGGSQGEVLQESNYERVTETFTLNVSTGNPLDRIRLENDLLYMKHNAEAFWAQDGNLDPVYLEWGVVGQTGIASAPIYQYAHVYSLDFAWSNSVPQTVVMTVVRRPDWWPIPPGSTPQRWTKYALSQTLTTSNALINIVEAGASNHRFGGYVHFNTHYSSGSYVYTGYLDIPGTSIPGNLPALATVATRLDWTGGGETPDVVVVGRYTKPLTFLSGGSTFTPLNTLPASIMNLGTDTTSVADSTATGNAANVSFATTASLASRLIALTGQNTGNFSTLVPGKYIVFARYRPTAITSTFTMQLRVNAGSSGTITTGDVVNIPALTGGDSYLWGVANLGEFTIPTEYNIHNGTGLDPVNGIAVQLWASRTGGAANLRIADLTFIPSDEACLAMQHVNTLYTNVTSASSFLVDGTGYSTRGFPETRGMYILTTFSTSFISSDPVEVRGNELTLRPGVTNRLYFFAYKQADASTVCARTNQTRSGEVIRLEVGVNIIPRWLGLRDT